MIYVAHCIQTMQGLRPANDTDKQPVDKTKGTASIAGMIVKDERAALIRQRALVRATHTDSSSAPYDPWNETITVNSLRINAAEFMYVFKKGQHMKTTSNARQMAARKKERRKTATEAARPPGIDP